MSALVGIFLRLGQPGAPLLAARALQPLTWRAPGLPQVSDASPAALGAVGTLPRQDARGFTVVLDGRIDNAAAVARTLGLPSSASAEVVILEGYRQWGQAFASRLLGDFVCIIWDPSERRLVAARDAVGVKPLYYQTTRDLALVASGLTAFSAADGTSPRVNDGMLAEYLACGITSLSETLYEGVFRLPPAHTLTIGADSVRVERYWDGRDAPDVRYPDDAQYDEHLRGLLAEAVRCRTLDAPVVGVLLSGGIDSSTVASIASATRPVVGCSNVFPGYSCDESRYIDAVTDATGITSLRVVPPVVCRDRLDTDATTFGDFPTYPNIATTDAARELAVANGIRVLLTGEGGDEWFSGSYYRYADLVRSGRLIALARAWRDDRSIAGPDGIEFPPHRLLRLGVVPNLPAAVRSALRRTLHRGAAVTAPSWMNREFAGATSVIDRIASGVDRDPGESFSRAHVRSVLSRASDVHYFEMMERSASRLGLDERHPFYDRRIIEFAVGLPPEQWWTRRPKELLRRAVRDLVPGLIRDRLTKANFSHVYAAALAAAGDHIVDALHPTLADRLNLPEVARMFGEVTRRYAAGDGRYTEHIWPCWMIYGLDRWLRARDAAPAERPAEEMAHA